MSITTRLLHTFGLGLLLWTFLSTSAFAQSGNTPLSWQDDANRPLAERFANPPGEARILKIVHGLPDGAEQQDDALTKLAELRIDGESVMCPAHGSNFSGEASSAT